MSAYLEYVDLYNGKNPRDNTMCKLAMNYMTKAPGSDGDKIARSLWTPSVAAGAVAGASKTWMIRLLVAVATMVTAFGAYRVITRER